MQLDSPLSSFGTLDLISARRKVELVDVVLPELLDITDEISGLMTVSEKSLILKYD